MDIRVPAELEAYTIHSPVTYSLDHETFIGDKICILTSWQCACLIPAQEDNKVTSKSFEVNCVSFYNLFWERNYNRMKRRFLH